MRGPRREYRLDDVLSTLWGVTMAGAGWVARCPLHPWTGRDLTILQDPTWAVLARITCWHGCTTRQVCEKAGIPDMNAAWRESDESR